MNKIRIRYSKTGKARYISHLDLMSLLTRALKRSGVRLAYSEGFNPHPYLSVALPLPVGCGSMCELADFGTEAQLLPDGLPELINPALPEGVEIISAYMPQRKFSDIKWIGLSGALCYDAGVTDEAIQCMTMLFTSENLIVPKKTKRGISDIDIIPYIRDVRVAKTGDTSAGIGVKVSAQDPTISGETLLSAMITGGRSHAPDFASFTRMELFGSNMLNFK